VALFAEETLSLCQLELKDGKVLELRIFIKVADKFLQVETMDGKKMQFRPEELSERDRQRRFVSLKTTPQPVNLNFLYQKLVPGRW